MRKFLAAVLAVLALVLALPAMAEEADVAHMRKLCEEILTGMLEEADGWEKLMLKEAEITSIQRDGKRLKAAVRMPKMQSGVTAKEKAEDDPADFLLRAVTPYAKKNETWDAELIANVKQNKDGTFTVKWASANQKKLQKSVAAQAKKARQSFETSEMEKALNQVLFPDAAQMPSRKPKKDVPEIGRLDSYAAQVAEILGFNQQQVSDRLPALMLLMEVTSVNAEDTLKHTVLSVQVKNWKGMLDAALTSAKARLDGMIGVPDMDRAALEAVFCKELPEALLGSYYSKKGMTTEKLTVDLSALGRKGVQEAAGVMDFYRKYMQAVEEKLDQLQAYADTLAYYPRVELIDTAILKGESVEGGMTVSFDMGEDKVSHGYVVVKKGEKTVLEAFIRNGVKLLVRMKPGDYTVYCTIGPEWFGEKHLLGKDAYFGVFDMPVQEGRKTVVHMQDVGGNLPVTDLTEAEFLDAVR